MSDWHSLTHAQTWHPPLAASLSEGLTAREQRASSLPMCLSPGALPGTKGRPTSPAKAPTSARDTSASHSSPID
eukprot:CAMPEP_0202055278 /NCGR_PEP_ID=MMETSP0963-20130614/17120_1 /ASSEMBLY_ACC=CAM_ASM_000494 /TAXON_ID=4773 /ORGANISM="Schizochytrium aggregatum, Strain ATCC28209" /LENGTH=73 /DNA_ID=CAMNT_0048620859 /DNA_START=222 /DNA_END=440 /DNA_ORIENTATION=+